MAIGSAVVLTHYLGAGDRAGAERVAATALSLMWLTMKVSTIPGRMCDSCSIKMGQVMANRLAVRNCTEFFVVMQGEWGEFKTGLIL